jgi:tRNA(fMet)-specific endonuclease VapC
LKKYLLDTNICIYFLKGLFDLDKKIEQVGMANCFISEITVAELKFGVETATTRKRTENQSMRLLVS